MMAMTIGRWPSLLLAAILLTGCDAFTSAETRVERAEESIAAGQYDAAVLELRKVLNKDADNVPARLLLARASLLLGDTPTAEKELDVAATGGADATEVEKLRLDLMLQSGRAEDASIALESAGTLSGTTRNIYEGRILLASSQPESALASFDEAIAAEPASREARLGRAEALAAAGRLDEARSSLDALVKDHPDYGAAWLALGTLDAREGRYQAATESLGTAAKNDQAMTRPQRIQVQATSVDVYLALNDMDGAGRAQAALDRQAAGSPIAMLSGARLALARKDSKRAVELLQQVVQAVPRLEGARALLVGALLQQGLMEQALAEAGKFRGDFPESETAILVLAQTQLQANRIEDAADTLQPLIDRTPPSTRALALAAQVELRRGRTVAGLDYLERGLETSPDDERVKIELAGAYVANGQADKAVDLLRSIPEGPGAAQRDRLLIVAVGATRDKAAAEKEIERALAENPGDPALLNLVASYFQLAGEPTKARDYLNKALEVAPEDNSARLALARLDLVDGKTEAATTSVQAVLKSAPSNLAALGLMAQIAASQGNEAEVERWLEEARSADPSAIVPRLQLARLATSRGDTGRTRQLIAEIEQGSPRAPRVITALGDLELAAGDTAKAALRYRQAIEYDPKLAQPRLGLARTLLQEKKPGQARQELVAAMELAPGWYPAASTFALIEASSGRVDDAVKVARDLQRRQPKDAAPLALEGQIRALAQQPAEAAKAYEAAYKVNPTREYAVRSALARNTAGLRKPEQPLLAWLEKSPEDVSARAALANIYMLNDQGDAARQEYERVVAARPQDAASLNNLAWLYQESGDARARETARKAYELAPDNASVADTYAWILVQEGETGKGLDILRQVYEKAIKNLEIQYHFAHALNLAGERQQAREVLRRALADGAAAGSQAVRDRARKLLAELEG